MNLAAKYRPQEFEEVCGQEHVKTILQNQIASNEIAHGYLFTGTRGIGKTTTARILARMVNDDGTMTRQELDMNIIEIDGASNNSVENIRNIRQEVNHRPAKGKYKVYIIDEVHMLSTSAFNAMLKTLEEPPAHIIFMLCTTEAHKIPATILSRCQRFDLQRFDVVAIANRLKYIAGQEGIKMDDSAITYIAKLGKGSMRDAISLFDQIRSYKEDITHADILKILGSVGMDTIVSIMDSITDPTQLLKNLKSIYYSGVDMKQFIKDLYAYSNDCLLVTKMGDGAVEYISTSDEFMPQLKKHSSIVNFRFLESLQELESELRYSDNEYILIQNKLLSLGGGEDEKVDKA
jgi:DNA polymerase-3 subunit gamma/tau